MPEPSPFQIGTFIGASGKSLWGKFEADNIPDEWWPDIACWIEHRVGPFGEVIGVPRGGLRLAECLRLYARPIFSTRLVVDDVLTTGGSIKAMMQPGDLGYVFLARGPLPPNVRALMTLNP